MEFDDSPSGPALKATKTGPAIHLSRDPYPDASGYLVVEAPGLLVLFPNRKDEKGLGPESEGRNVEVAQPSNHDAQLRRAFDALGARVTPSIWSSSSSPHAELIAGFRALAQQSAVAEDVSAYLSKNPSVGHAVQMLFTSIAMSARADWRSVPAQFRGVAARGWFLGRWIPTFLVLDGPILRFLKSDAFRRQNGSPQFLRAIRSFFDAKDFMALRHAFAHWSFAWATDGADSEIVAVGQSASDEIRVSWKEVDALHILTFAVVETIHDVFIQGTSRQ